MFGNLFKSREELAIEKRVQMNMEVAKTNRDLNAVEKEAVKTRDLLTQAARNAQTGGDDDTYKAARSGIKGALAVLTWVAGERVKVIQMGLANAFNQAKGQILASQATQITSVLASLNPVLIAKTAVQVQSGQMKIETATQMIDDAMKGIGVNVGGVDTVSDELVDSLINAEVKQAHSAKMDDLSALKISIRRATQTDNQENR